MLAKQLQTVLAREAMKTNLSLRSPADLAERFETLRGYGLLPAGRTKNITSLSHPQIVSGVLSLGTTKSGFAGLAATCLAQLRPVGGPEASFQGSVTLGGAIESLLNNRNALNSFIELRVSDSEIYTNAHGLGAITYRAEDAIITSYYVAPTAVSCFQPGAEESFNPRELVSSVITETLFYLPFFERLVRELERDAKAPQTQLAVPLEDEDEETQKEARARRLGLMPNSRFLNIGVDNQVTWPPQETAVEFEGIRLILFPKTRENTTSVHIDLQGQRISAEKATTLINRFLSCATRPRAYAPFRLTPGLRTARKEANYTSHVWPEWSHITDKGREGVNGR